ncbi:MAG: hypothetical protein IT336_16335 [Thermomicrobiales bacterium]|nr:hypothetical protein [Thermomicrobiales bacterium]
MKNRARFAAVRAHWFVLIPWLAAVLVTLILAVGPLKDLYAAAEESVEVVGHLYLDEATPLRDLPERYAATTARDELVGAARRFALYLGGIHLLAMILVLWVAVRAAIIARADVEPGHRVTPGRASRRSMDRRSVRFGLRLLTSLALVIYPKSVAAAHVADIRDGTRVRLTVGATRRFGVVRAVAHEARQHWVAARLARQEATLHAGDVPNWMTCVRRGLRGAVILTSRKSWDVIMLTKQSADAVRVTLTQILGAVSAATILTVLGSVALIKACNAQFASWVGTQRFADATSGWDVARQAGTEVATLIWSADWDNWIARVERYLFGDLPLVLAIMAGLALVVVAAAAWLRGLAANLPGVRHGTKLLLLDLAERSVTAAKTATAQPM